MAAYEVDQSQTKKQVLINSAKIEEETDGRLNETWVLNFTKDECLYNFIWQKFSKLECLPWLFI